MKNVPIYQALAQAFAMEGVDTHFTLVGDGNMHKPEHTPRPRARPRPDVKPPESHH